MKCSLTIGTERQPMAKREGLGKGRPGVHRLSGKPLSITHPSLIIQWNDSRFLPDSVSFGSSIPVDWKCEICDHCWHTSPNARITKSKVSGCPVCTSGSLHSDRRNSLLNTHPYIAKDFDSTKNADLTANEIVAGTNKKIWWKCHLCDYEWKASGNHRTNKGRNCKACNNQAVKPDKSNSLAMAFPNLVEDFDYSKNGDLTPLELTQGGKTKIWWKCQTCEHSWSGRISHRTSTGAGCPCCSGNDVHSDGRNSMRNTHPNLALEFHPSKNQNMTPDNVKAGTGRRIWWICRECKHEWKVAGSNRISQDSNCPACVGKAVHMDGRNSLEIMRPELTKEWHPRKNGNNTPKTTLYSTNKRIWWICKSCQHEWGSRCLNRSIRDVGCPVCAGKAVHIDGRNSMTTTHPDLVKEFHSTKNGELRPDGLIAGTAKKLWWICNTCNGEWKTSGSERRMGTGCPYCANVKVHPDGRNSLAKAFPNLMKEWHFARNIKLNPDEVVFGTHRKAWWKCSTCDGEWRTGIVNRTRAGSGCPSCANYGFDPILPAYYYCMEISGASGIWWYKGGISADVEFRRGQIERSLKSNGMHLNVKIASTIHFNHGKDAKKLETRMLSLENIRQNTAEKFDGSSELFSENPITHARENGLIEQQKLVQTTIDMWLS